MSNAWERLVSELRRPYHRRRTGELVLVIPRNAGLGNRMRALAGAAELAERSGRVLSYVWPTRPPGVECVLTDLWRFPNGRPLSKEAFTRSYADVPTLSHDTSTWTDDERARKVWLVWTSEVMRFDGAEFEWRRRLATLEPSDAVDARLRALRAQLDGRTYIGVQVRSSPLTHEKTLTHSPVEWFETRMDQLAALYNDPVFFLSCDTVEARQRLTSLGHVVVTQHHDFPYNSRDASIAAVADLHMLAGSQHLVGPYWSSFVDLAWDMAGRGITREDSLRTWEPGDERPRRRAG